jgi:hypothetical protein
MSTTCTIGSVHHQKPICMFEAKVSRLPALCQPSDSFQISKVGRAPLMPAATAAKSLQVEPAWRTGLNYLSAW